MRSAIGLYMIVLLVAISIVMGTILGMLGGGGSILTVPILTYIAEFSPKQAITASLVVVGITSAFATLLRAKAGTVRWRTGFLFGGVSMTGAYGGGRAAAFVPGWILLALFASLMIMTSLMMLGKKKNNDTTSKPKSDNLPLLASQALLVGVVTGFIGAGGGFIVVPALVLLAGLPMQQAIGTSLLVITLNSSAAVVGQLNHVDIDWKITLMIAFFAVVGTVFGTRLSSRIPAQTLRKVFAWFVLAMGIMILVKEIIL